MRKIRVISNLGMLELVKSSDFELDLLELSGEPSRLKKIFQLFRRSYNYDYIVLNGAPRLVFALAMLKWLFPRNSCRLVVLDILLSAPTSFKQEIKALIVKFLLKRVHLIILYYKNTTGLQNEYSIPASKFRYVPFKINQFELVSQTIPTDGGYIFCGGKTRRDFDCLMTAVESTDLPVKIVTTENRDIAEHGSYLDQSKLPANVEAIILDGSPQKFIELLAAARIVAMPIIPGIAGVGIGVCIMAMALRKCVVMSDIPGSSDILPDGAAILVPPSDPGALRDALSKAFHDRDFRNEVAETGYRYARPLGGEKNLMISVADVIFSDFGT